MICSFDIFDTTITRVVGNPSDVFLLVANKIKNLGLWDCSALAFSSLRIRAEAAARANTNAQEITISEIYQELAFLTDNSAEWAIQVQAIELEVELSLLRPVPTTVAHIEKLRALNQLIIFISDTYISSAVLINWLNTLSIWRPDDRIYASSDIKLTKQTGDLFRYVIADIGISPFELQHRGDNIKSDVNVPAAMGIAVQHINDCALTLREQHLAEMSTQTDGLAAIHAGTSRLTRLLTKSQDYIRTESIDELAASVAAPVLSSFVIWILKSAISKKVSRLLFVARDGQLLKEIADQIIARLNLALSTEYVYAGRQVVNLAGTTRIDENTIEWILESATNLGPSELFARIDLTVDDVRETASTLNLDISRNIHLDDIEKYKKLLQHQDIAPLILQAALRRRNTLKEYFDHIGALSNDCAFIDVGWRGRVFSAVNAILGNNNHIALYFGLYSQPIDVQEKSMNGFMFETISTNPYGLVRKTGNLANIIEIFCQATHGQVIGIEKVDNGFKPRLRTKDNNVGNTWDIYRFQEIVVAYTKLLPLETIFHQPMQPRIMVEKLINAVLRSPSRYEANILSSFSYNDDQGGVRVEPFAIAYSPRDIISTLLTGKFPRKSYVWWEEGAQHLTKPYIMIPLKIARRIGNKIVNHLHSRSTKNKATSF